ncbi:hypothetical protein GDO86_019848 [Hymenochirus boettgeri]|uniref:Uncharacterized protein n=1 Tax=Hymenochirus boettgeri TaxID=247094 RepID=A0A8T2IEN0_9PIPI|nr:hypothetical protein GDO86_019848 [Hymenochirus boettgeri]
MAMDQNSLITVGQNAGNVQDVREKTGQATNINTTSVMEIVPNVSVHVWTILQSYQDHREDPPVWHITAETLILFVRHGPTRIFNSHFIRQSLYGKANALVCPK